MWLVVQLMEKNGERRKQSLHTDEHLSRACELFFKFYFIFVIIA